MPREDNPFGKRVLGELDDIEVGGQTEDQAVLLHDRERRLLVRLRSLESLRLANAVQLLGPRVLEIASDRESLSRLRGEIAEAAYPNQISEQNVLGQGVHWFGDEWLMVSGTDAVSSAEGVLKTIRWRDKV